MCTYNILMFSSISFGNSAMFLQLSFCISHLQSDAHFELAVCPQRKNIRKNNDEEAARNLDPCMLLQKQVLRDVPDLFESQIIYALSRFRTKTQLAADKLQDTLFVFRSSSDESKPRKLK